MSAPQQGWPGHPGQQGWPDHPGQPAPDARAGRNPLGLVSLILGAAISLLGLLFILVQAAVVGAGSTETLGAISGIHGVISALLSIAAIVIGVIAILRRGLSKTFAAAGIALGAAGLVAVIGSFAYGLLIQLFFSF